jgi:hypothetical protein
MVARRDDEWMSVDDFLALDQENLENGKNHNGHVQERTN